MGELGLYWIILDVGYHGGPYDGLVHAASEDEAIDKYVARLSEYAKRAKRDWRDLTRQDIRELGQIVKIDNETMNKAKDVILL